MPVPVLQTQGGVTGASVPVTSGSLIIELPAYQADDIVVITTVGWVPNTTTGTNTQSLSSPWTKYSPNQTLITSSIIDGEWALFWARATSNSSLGTLVTFTRPTSWDTGTDTCWGGRAYIVRGCRTTGDPWDAITAGSLQSAANAAFPGVSYSDGNNLVVQFLVSADNQASGAAPSGWTAGTEAASTVGTDCMFQTFRQTFSVSGSGTSTASTSATGAPNQGRYIFFAASFTPPAITATANNSWGGWTSTSSATVTENATINSSWGGWTATSTGTAGAPSVPATANDNWGGWTATAIGAEEHPASVSSNWGNVAATADGALDHPAAISTDWGGWTATAETIHAGTIDTNFGGLTATANGSVERAATATANWGAWSATAVGVEDHSGAISSNLGGWAATAAGDLEHHGSVDSTFGITLNAAATVEVFGAIADDAPDWTATAIGTVTGGDPTIASNFGPWTSTAVGVVDPINPPQGGAARPKRRPSPPAAARNDDDEVVLILAL